MNRPQPTQANNAELCQAQSLRPRRPARLVARPSRRLVRAEGADPLSSAFSPFNRAPAANARVAQAPIRAAHGQDQANAARANRPRPFSGSVGLGRGLKQKSAPGLGEAEFGRARATADRREAKHGGLVELVRRAPSGNAGRSGFRSPKEKAPRADFNATRRFIFAPLTIATAWRAAPKTQSTCPTTAIVPNKGRHLSNGFADKGKSRSPICLRPMPIMIAAFKARRRAPPHPPHSRRAPAQQTGSIQTEWPTARRNALRSHRIVAINHKL